MVTIVIVTAAASSFPSFSVCPMVCFSDLVFFSPINYAPLVSEIIHSAQFFHFVSMIELYFCCLQ